MIGSGGEKVLALGIDAGGSYTDAVIMDVHTKEIIAKMKSRTTHDDMIVGMTEAMNGLILKRQFNPRDIRFVGLSTTLATNSILESKGGKVGLITIGWEPDKDILMAPVKEFSVPGGHEVTGNAITGLGENALIDAAKELEKVADNIVLAAKFSYMNDGHERRAKQILADKVKIPVIATYELSRDIGMYERTNTAILNGMLLPVINDFILGVMSLLSRYGIKAHVMMMKGDGTMMKIETAKLRPVETIMSGPAASIVGGLALSGCTDGMIVDVGSTSTDIACIRDGMPPVSKRGAVVIGKKTHVRTMDAHTIALGGDSHLMINADGNVTIGPKRSVPLATASVAYPVLKERMRKDDNVMYLIPHKDRTRALTPSETKVLDFIKANAPCKVSDISDEYPTMYTLPSSLESLMTAGSIIFTSLTPTDLMVITDRFVIGDREASELGLSILSRKSNMTGEQLILKVMDQAVINAGRAIIEKVLIDETGKKEFDLPSERLISAAVGRDRMEMIDTKLTLNVPIIGLGGPAGAYLSSLRHRLDTDVIIPDNHDIGNAIGTVRSKISETSYAMIIPSQDGGYDIRSSFHSVIKIMHFDEAVDTAIKMTSSDARLNIEKQGGIDIVVHTDIEDVDPRETEDIKNVMKVSARATGDPMEYIVGFRYK
ncbi:MAG: hydantoinase/oxoprolinase family protein [Methanomassiliicoccaceae archaeon]|jgi:N-methylhydantoinase A/oxoprolinase/acetone carboxylase beta subunit|nr:hydantoinase/oxoprolinase family protein [Methanomassiliicoccaceae archaeon]